MPIMAKIDINRICIYSKDIERITGRKGRTARKLLNEIRKKLGKAKNDFVTVTEFCDHTGLNEDEVRKFLID